MTSITTVSSFEHFEHVINGARVSHPRCTLVFRGQTRDRPILSSMQRADAASDPFVKGDVNYAWHEFARTALSDLGVSSNQLHLAMALVQHYGYRSWFLDVTHDPLIALWFAVHSFNGSHASFVDESEEPHIIYDPVLCALYKRSPLNEGFVYVFAVSDSQVRQVLLDLAALMPKSALRVHRQRAAAMLSMPSLDPARFLIATLRVSDDLMKHVFPPDISPQSLFPPPSADPVYKAFVRVPFFVPTRRRLQSRSIVACPLLVFPFYIHHKNDWFVEFQPHLNLVPFQFFFFHEPARANLAYSVRKTCRLQDAIPIYTPRLPYWDLIIVPQQVNEDDVVRTRSGSDIETLDFSIWRQHGVNLFFELSLGAHLLRPFAAEYNHVIRGFWVLLDDDWIYISKIFERFGRRGSEFFADRGMHFTRIESSYKCTPMQGDCPCRDLESHRTGELAFLATLTRLRVDGTLSLGFDPELGYLVLKRRGEPRSVDQGSPADPQTDSSQHSPPRKV
jgi:FRG domain